MTEMEERKGGNIHELSIEVRSALRSGLVITSMAQCVVELVLNALDAGATSIAVRVNFKFHKIQVIDNGNGITATDLDLIGKRYMTSKCHSMDDLRNYLNHFGFRGEALASLREVSGLLILESRPEDSDITYCKVFTHGKSQMTGISKTKRAGQGTTISVHDFLYNMPVRRKRIRSAIDLEEIKSRIECIAVIHPQVSFSLRNDTNGSIILHTRKFSDTISAFSHLFDETIAQSLVAVSSSLGEFRISGFISKQAHQQKNLQFIYVNKRLILKTKLHKLANSMLGNSFILRTNTTSRDIPISKETSTGRWLAFSPPQKRGRYAVYLLNVECPYSVYDICLDPKKTLIEFCDWDTILQCVESTIRTFLEKEYSLSLSQDNLTKIDTSNISLLKEIECLEKDYTIGQLQSQQMQTNVLLSAQGENSSKYDQADVLCKKMLDVSRAVYSKPAKRRADSKTTHPEDDLCLPNRVLANNETSVSSIFTILLDSEKSNSDNRSAITDLTSNPILNKCESEDPYFKSEPHSLVQQNAPLLSQIQERFAANTVIRNLNSSFSGLSEIPIIEFDCETSTEKYGLIETDENLNSMDKFRKIMNHRLLPKYPSHKGELPPITKFRRMYGCISNVEFTIPMKNHALQQYFFCSELEKSGINITHENEETRVAVSVKGVTVDGYLTTRGKLLNRKDVNDILSSKVTSNLKSLGQQIVGSNVSKDTHINRKYDCQKKLYTDNSTYDFTLKNTSKMLHKLNAKSITDYETTKTSKRNLFKFEKNLNHCSTTFPKQLTSGKEKHFFNKNKSSLEKIIEVEESVLELHNSFCVPEHHCTEASAVASNSMLPATVFDTSVTGCLKSRSLDHNFERNCSKTSEFLSNVRDGKVKKWLDNVQDQSKCEETIAKVKKSDTNNIFAFSQGNKQICKTSKRIDSEINTHKSFLIPHITNKSSCTSYDFLHTLEMERIKRNEYLSQENVSNCNETNVERKHARVRVAKYDKLHNKQICDHPATFQAYNHLKDSSKCCILKLFDGLSTPNCPSRNVGGEEKCMIPHTQNVTFHFPSEASTSHQFACRNMLQISKYKNVAGSEKFTEKHIQISECTKQQCVNSCIGEISKDVKMADHVSGMQEIRNNMIPNSGSEADAELSTETESGSRKGRKGNALLFNKFEATNERLSKNASVLEWLNTQHTVNNSYDETLKRKICCSPYKSKRLKLNALSEISNSVSHFNTGTEQFEKPCSLFEGEQENTGSVMYEREKTCGSSLKLCYQRDGVDRTSLIDLVAGKTEDSNDTIVPSSGSSNAALLHSVHIVNRKVIIDDSSPDISICNVISHQTPTDILCSQNKSIIYSDENNAEDSRLFTVEYGEKVAITKDVCLFNRKTNSIDTVSKITTIQNDDNNICEELMSEIVTSEKNCPELPSAKLSGASNTLKIIDIFQSSNSDETKQIANKNGTSSIMDTSCRENSDMSRKICLPEITVIAKNHNSINYNETKIISDNGRLLHPPCIAKCNEVLDIEIVTQNKMPSIENIPCDDKYSLMSEESTSKNAKPYGVPDTCHLEGNFMSENVSCILDNLSLNEKLLQMTSTNQRSSSDNYIENESEQTLKRYNVSNSYKNHCEVKCETLFSESVERKKNDTDKLMDNNFCEKGNEIGSDVIEVEDLPLVVSPASELQDKVLIDNDNATEQNLNELFVLPVTSIDKTVQKVCEKEGKLSYKKRRHETNFLDVYGKKTCLEENNVNISTTNSKSYKSNDSASETYMSNSISTQELNEAFEGIMNKLTKSDQQNDTSITAQVNVINHSSEVELNKEQDKISCQVENTIDKRVDLKCPEGWEQRLNTKGKIYFVHKESGTTSFTVPKHSVAQNVYSMSKRFAFLPKGMSPVLKDGVKKSQYESREGKLTPDSYQALCSVITGTHNTVDELAVVKWKDLQEKKETVLDLLQSSKDGLLCKACSELVKKMLTESESQMQFCEKEVPNACVEELSKSMVKVYNIIYPYTFSKDSISNFKVLGQLDNKFIVTKVDTRNGKNENLIVLFDQHAVHERIRLEGLMKDYLVEGSESEFRTSEVNPQINICLSGKEIRILSCFQKEFENLGLHYKVLDNKSIEVTSVPMCLLARELRETRGRGISVLKDFLESMIREEVDSILTTRGVGIRVPAILHSVISSEACRGAVKFGDTLFPEECEILLKNLSECEVPFQCAHGRPSLVPIVDLHHLHVQQTQVPRKPRLWKLKKSFET